MKLDVKQVALYEATWGGGALPRTYLAVSTAPMSVEDPALEPTTREIAGFLKNDVLGVTQMTGVESLADAINAAPNPRLVLFFHGFNNSVEDVCHNHAEARKTLASLSPVEDDPQTLFVISCRWPAEKLGSPFASTFTAAPLIWTLLGVLGLIPIIWGAWRGKVWLALLGLLPASIPVATTVMRGAVYFRDSYRATNYGVPDFMNFLRALDNRMGVKERPSPVPMSFIAHSLGNGVATSLIRILSDAFKPGSIADPTTEDSGTWNRDTKRLDDRIGNNLCLGRLIMIAPDIPAETLLQGRSNPLLSSLNRFDEVYLFSNIADEVLRQISRLGNVFIFPNRTREHGFRLGNVEVTGDTNYGLHLAPGEGFLNRLKVGGKTFAELSDAEKPSSFPERITYFDCSDYEEERKRLLSWWHPNRPGYPHWWLLLNYLFRSQPDVHSGYLDGDTVRRAIYGLAAFGWNGYKPEATTLPEDWERVRLRVLRKIPQPSGIESEP